MTTPVAQKRFIRRGVAKFFYLKAVANPTVGPTRTELDAGIDITSWIAGISGFAVTATSVDTPDMGSRYASKIPGNIESGDSSFTVYDDIDSEEVETTFPMGDRGFVYIMRKGDKPATPTSDLFPTEVASRTPNMTTDLSAASSVVNLTITGLPWLDLDIPAAA